MYVFGISIFTSKFETISYLYFGIFMGPVVIYHNCCSYLAGKNYLSTVIFGLLWGRVCNYRNSSRFHTCLHGSAVNKGSKY